MGKQRNPALENVLSSLKETSLTQQDSNYSDNLSAKNYIKDDVAFNEQEIANIDDTLYDRQSWGEALKNVAIKGVAKTGLRGADMALGLIGAVAELPDYLADGGLGYTGDDDNKKRKGVSGFLDLLSDNMYSQNITRPAEEYLDNNFQVFQNKEQQDEYVGLNLGNLDKLVDGVSYVAGMILGGGLSKSILKGAKALPNLIKTGATTAKEIGDLAKISSVAGKTGLSFFDDVSKTAGNIKELLKTNSTKFKGLSDFGDELLGGFTESAAEAAATKETIIKNNTERLLKETGQSELTEEQLTKIEDEARVGAGTNFVINMITTTLANATVFRPLLNSKWVKNVRGVKELDNEINNKIIQKADNGYKIAEKSKKWYNNAFTSNYAQSIAKNAGIEASQELSQFYSNDYITNLLSEPHDETVENMADIYGLTSKKYFEAFNKTNSNLTSVDAVQSALIGAIIGGGVTALTNKGKYSAIDANTARLVANANDKTLTGKDYQQYIRLASKSLDNSQVADGATINGDKHTAKDHENLAAINYILSRQAIGKTDDIIQELEDSKKLNNKTFNEKYGFEKNLEEKDKIETIDNLIALTKKIDKSSKEITSNYGAKINVLSKKEGNENMLTDLITLDVFQQSMQDRLNSLEKKFIDNGVTSWKELTGKAISQEEIAEKETEIADIRKQITDLQEDKIISPLEKIKQINVLQSALVDKQNLLNNSVSEDNILNLYSQEVNKNYNPESDEKSFKYKKYSNDLNDYKKIHEAKNKVVDYISQIVNDESHYDNVSKRIRERKLDERTLTDFSLVGNQIPKVVTDKDGKPVLDDEGKEQTIFEYKADKDGANTKVIKTGQVYNLNSKIFKGKDKGNTTERVEVQKLFYKDGQPFVNVLNTQGGFNNRGRDIPLSIFKNNVVNIGKDRLSDDFDNEGIAIWRKYKNRIILYKYKGRLIKGKLGLSSSFVKDGKLSNTDMFRLSYYNGEKESISFIDGITKYDLQNNIIEVYDEERSHLESLRIYAQTYLKTLNDKFTANEESKKELSTKLQEYKDIQSNLTVEEKSYYNQKGEVKKNLSKAKQEEFKKLLDNLEKTKSLIQNVENQLIRTESSPYTKEFIDEVTDVYDELKTLDINAEMLPDSLRKLYDERNAYNDARKTLRKEQVEELEQSEERIVLEQESQDLSNLNQEQEDLLLNQLNQTVIIFNEKFPDNALELNKDTYGEKLNLIYQKLEEGVKNTLSINTEEDIDTELYDSWINLIKTNQEVYNRYKDEAAKFYKAVADKMGTTEDVPVKVKNIQLRLLSKFYTWVNNKGFFYSGTNYSPISAKTEVNNNDIEGEGSVFTDNDSTVYTANPLKASQLVQNPDKPNRVIEQRNYFNLAYKLPYDTKFSVTVEENDIYLTTTIEGKTLGTYLTLKDSALRKEIIEAWKKDNNVKLTGDGKMTLYDIPKKEVGESNEDFAKRINSFKRPSETVKKEIGTDGKLIIATSDSNEIGNLKIYSTAGRAYLVSEKNGTKIPLLLNNLSAKVNVINKGTGKTEQKTITELLSHAIISFENAFDNADYRNFNTVTKLFSNFMYYVDSLDKLEERRNDKGGSPALIQRDNETGTWVLQKYNNDILETIPLIRRTEDGNIEMTEEGILALDSRLLNINSYLVDKKINVETYGSKETGAGFKLEQDYDKFLSEAGTSVAVETNIDINGKHNYQGAKFVFTKDSLVQPKEVVTPNATTKSNPVVEDKTILDEEDDFAEAQAFFRQQAEKKEAKLPSVNNQEEKEIDDNDNCIS